MSIAKIITCNPESTENLAAYLRARGYEVFYAHPDDPQSQSEDLTITVEACSDRLQALTRASEITASHNCDVFVGEGIAEELDLPQESAAQKPKATGDSLKETATRIMDQRIKILRSRLRAAGRWNANLFSWKQSLNKARQEITTRIRLLPQSRIRHYHRDWKILFTGSTVAALLLLLVVSVFMAHAPASGPSRSQPPALEGIPAASGARTTLSLSNAHAEAAQRQAVATPEPTTGEGAAVVSDHTAASLAGNSVPHKRRRRIMDKQSDREPEVIVRHTKQPSTHPTAKTRPGIKHYSDLN